MILLLLLLHNSTVEFNVRSMKSSPEERRCADTSHHGIQFASAFPRCGWDSSAGSRAPLESAWTGGFRGGGSCASRDGRSRLLFSPGGGASSRPTRFSVFLSGESQRIGIGGGFDVSSGRSLDKTRKSRRVTEEREGGRKGGGDGVTLHSCLHTHTHTEFLGTARPAQQPSVLTIH